MRTAVRLWFVAMLASLPLFAQDGAALAQRENKLRARSITALNEIADELQEAKQHQRAMQMRREILSDLDENDLKARAGLGFARVGSVWRRDQNMLVLDKDMKGDPKALKKIDQELEVLARDLGNEHKALAEA